MKDDRRDPESDPAEGDEKNMVRCTSYSKLFMQSAAGIEFCKGCRS